MLLSMRLLILLTGLFVTSVAYAQDNIVLRNGEEISSKVLEVNLTDLKYRKASNPDGPVYTAPLRDVLFIKYANGTKDTFGPNRMPSTGASAFPNDARNTGFPPTSAPGLDPLRYRSRWFNRHFEGAAGQRVSRQQVETLLRLQPNAFDAFERGRSLRTWSVVTVGSAVALLGAGVGVALAGEWGDGRGRGFGNQNLRNGNERRDREPGRNVAIGAALAGGGLLLGVASGWLDHRATVQFRRAAARYNTRPATSLRLAPSRQGLGAGLTFAF